VKIIIIAHNLRSSHNVGSLLRTSEGLGIEKIYLTGYTPYPKTDQRYRLPHIANRVDKAIRKTALGAEEIVNWEQSSNIDGIIKDLKQNDYLIVGLEQTENSVLLHEFKYPDKLAIVLGNEVQGIDKEVLKLCSQCIEIPMLGKKSHLMSCRLRQWLCIIVDLSADIC
jgi:tRNA G18 (ribose-2'-O)-methylase SpoU